MLLRGVRPRGKLTLANYSGRPFPEFRNCPLWGILTA